MFLMLWKWVVSLQSSCVKGALPKMGGGEIFMEVWPCGISLCNFLAHKRWLHHILTIWYTVLTWVSKLLDHLTVDWKLENHGPKHTCLFMMNITLNFLMLMRSWLIWCFMNLFYCLMDKKKPSLVPANNLMHK